MGMTPQAILREFHARMDIERRAGLAKFDRIRAEGQLLIQRASMREHGNDDVQRMALALAPVKQ